MKWLKFFLRKSAIEKELDSEIRFHLESVIQEKTAAGFSADEARRLATLEFGGAEQVKEECRSVHRLAVIETALANLKSAVRFISLGSPDGNNVPGSVVSDECSHNGSALS
jgi:putative ABC transport system permease protein